MNETRLMTDTDRMDDFIGVIRMAFPIMQPRGVCHWGDRLILHWRRRNILKEFLFGEPLRFGWYWAYE